MGEAILIFLIFGTVITITAVVFGGWLIFGVARMMFRVFAFVLGADNRSRPVSRMMSGNGAALPGTHPVICPNPQCHAGNRAEARFCRRCGAIMPSPQYAQVRRAAMW
jgi:hypothetical protein